MLRLILLATIRQGARASRRLTYCTWLVAGLGAAELATGHPGEPSGDWKAQLSGMLEEGPAPLAEGDADRDGLADTWEDALAARYAPAVILDQEDWNRPSSLPWLLARADFRREGGVQANYAGVARLPERSDPSFDHEVRRGSDDARDWTSYVHVYPRADGGINVQYWFYYPYNDGPLLFDHESDWEHATVRLDARGEPVGVYLARHEDNDPGPYWPWSRVRRDGDHPVVLSARGSHATYADDGDVPWFERAGACADLGACEHPVWRTWQSGLQNLGERARPRVMADVLTYSRRWGQERLLPGTSAPVGPAYQRGFCHAGFRGCTEQPGDD